jgi:fumagillin biosynthesis methyltransferase
MFDGPILYAAIQTLRDLGVWDAWAAAGGGEQSVEGLVKLANTQVAPNLLRRLLSQPSRI